jgi:RNA polymerase sigma-70 factor (ECF subfamily)
MDYKSRCHLKFYDVQNDPSRIAVRVGILHNYLNRTMLPQCSASRDEELVALTCAGNEAAFTVLFNRYSRLVLVTALRMLGDIGEAEDISQAVFLEIYRKADQFDPAKGTFKSWLLQYAYHRSINRKNYLTLRHLYKHEEADGNDADAIAGVHFSPPNQEATQLVNESLDLLNQQQRQVIYMVFFEGLSLKDVAQQTGTTFVNVRHHYYRGLQRLRECLTTANSYPALLRQEP